MRWQWSYRSLIRPAWLVITAGPTRTVLPRGLRSRRQQGDRQLLAVVQYPRHPGHCVQLCIIYAWARRVLNPRCHRNIRARRQTCARRVCCPVACRGAQIASPTHPSLLHALRQIRDSRCGVGVQWEAVSLTLRTRPGLGLAEGFTSGRLFAVFSHWQALTDYKRCHPSDIILHSFDASSRRHIDRLGRLRDHLRLVIRPSAHVAHGGPDAISSNQHYFCSSAAAREPNKPCNAFTPEPSTQALSVAVAS